MSRLRYSETPASECDIFCAQCDQIIGGCPNEWIKLTNTYARSREKGFHFNTRVGESVQVVPFTENQNVAEGCLMKDVFCTKCKNTVGQYCSAVPDRERARLKDKHFYKEHRIYLKDKSSNERVRLFFVDEVDEDIQEPIQRTSMGPPTLSSRVSLLSGGTKVPTRQSYPGAVPQGTRAVTYEPQPGSPARRPTPDYGLSRAASAEPQIAAQAQNIADVSNRVTLTDTRLSNHIIRTNQYETQLSQHDVELDSHAIEIAKLVHKSAQTYENVVTNTMDHLKHQDLIDQQNDEIKSLKKQVAILHRNFDQLKDLITDNAGNLKYTQNGFDEHLAKLRRDNRESEALRDENRMLKAKLQSAANVLTFSNGVPADGDNTVDLSGDNDDASSRGKRKRTEELTEEDRHKRPQTGKSVAQIFGTDRQLPSPESRHSEEPVKHNTLNAINQHRHSDMFGEWQRAQNALKQREVERDTRERTQQDRFNTNVRQSLPAQHPSTIARNSQYTASTPLGSMLGRTESPFRSNRPKSLMSRITPASSVDASASGPQSGQLSDYTSIMGIGTTQPSRPSNIGPLGPRPVVQDDFHSTKSTSARNAAQVAQKLLNRPTANAALALPSNIQAAIQNLNEAAESHRQSYSPAIGDADAQHADNDEDELAIDENAPSTAPRSLPAINPSTSAFSAVNLLNKAASPAKSKLNGPAINGNPIRQPNFDTAFNGKKRRPGRGSDTAVPASTQANKGLATTVARRGPAATKPAPATKAAAPTATSDGIDHVDNCTECGGTGRLLCCDGCPNAYHHRCLNPPKKTKDKIEGDWFCPECVANGGATNDHAAAPPPPPVTAVLSQEELAERELLAQALMQAAEQDEIVNA